MENNKDNKKEVVVQTTTIKENIDNSIIPSIKEIERFIIFLNNKFGLGLHNNIIINIQSINPKTKGFFMPKQHLNHYENTKQKLHYICLSSYHLKKSPYETIAHEIGHFYNEINKIKDVSSNQYHNKFFKEIAERLLLKVERTNKGYAYTKETDDFKKMIEEEFKPDIKAFHIQQNHKDKKEKKPSRNLLYMCSCGVKIRSALNEEKPLKAICQYCKTEFQKVEL